MFAPAQSGQKTSFGTSIRHHAAAAVVFAGLAVAVTYPLILHVTSAVAGRSSDHEEAAFAWNLWWTRHALLDLHQSPLLTDYILQPFTIDLRLHTFAPLYGVLSIPLQFLLGAGGALNLLVLLTIMLNGYTAYLLARHALVRSEPALVAGALVALSPALIFHLRAGKPSFAATWPVALALLFLARFAGNQRWLDVLGLSLAMLAALLLDFQIIMFAGLWLALFGACLIGRNTDLLSDTRFVGGIALVLGSVAIPLWLIFYRALVSAGARGYPVPAANDTLNYSLYPALFVTPWFVRFMFGAVLPVAVLGAVATGRWIRNWAFWLAGGIVFLVLSWGIVLQPTQLPLPFAGLRTVPGMAQFRTPYRFTIPAVLGLALVAAGGWSYWQARLLPTQWRSAATLILLGLILFDSRSVAPFVLQSYPDDPVYRRLADMPGDFTVLEVPVGVRSGTDAFGYGDFLQFYQTIHGKRGINGMVARVPRRVFDYYRTSPSLRLLAGEPVDADAGLSRDFADRLRELDVGYVVVHPNMLDSSRLARVTTLLARERMLTRIEAAPTIWLYRVARPSGASTDRR